MDNNETPQSVISNDIEITGTIKGSGSLRIDGKLEGELHCGGDAIIGKSAQIKGNIVVTSVSIEGSINGNVTAKDRIEMKSTARVTGDIRAKRLSVEDGVTFIGRSEVNSSGSPISGVAPTLSETTESGDDDRTEAAATVRSYARR
ncbi:MAG TPA: polymer-forming cytoskeletal protein [Verrucomicrobiae bacterium]|nr:polymer-forming cytoskeletal protein [Verrucomicrobiae bacterium]